jgi:hypothetical protein
MAVFGISSNPKSNRLSNANFEGLPLPIFKGSLSVSLSFEGQPQGSISIESISEEEIQQYRTTYNVIGKKLVLLDTLYFEISSYSETEDLISVSPGSQIRVYNLSINLRGGNEIRSSASVEVRTSVKDAISFGPNLTINGKLNAASVAGAVGISYSGYSYIKDIPKDSGSFKTTFSSIIQENLRLKAQVLDWTGRTVRSRNYLAGSKWSVSSHDILYSIDVSKQQEAEYLNTTLSGKGGLPFIEGLKKKESLKDQFGDNRRRKAPVRLVTLEGDLKPTKPPNDVRKLRTIDMNFDFSGPRKTTKTTTTLNGQPSKERIDTYGFVYMAQDLRNPEAEDETSDISVPALKSDEPEEWWQLIETQTTEYIYQSANVSATVTGKDKDGKTYTGQVVGSSLFNSTYLTEIRTEGWKLARFQQEQFDEAGTDSNSLDSRWLRDEILELTNTPSPTPDDTIDLAYAKAQLKTITFKKIPFKSITQYYLVPATDIYKDIQQAPFQTQFVTKESIGQKGEGSVLIAIPDPAYTFPLKVLEERSLTQSFDQIDHPQNIYVRQDREEVSNDDSLSAAEKKEELKGLKLLPSLTTGEDTYRSTLRKIIPSANTTGRYGSNSRLKTDLYLEYESDASHQDHNFQYSLQEKTFRTTTGQLPDATTFSHEFHDSDKDKEDEKEADSKEFEYLISTTSSSQVGLAIAAARCELALANFSGSTDMSMKLAWFYPAIRPGDYLEVVDDGSKRNLRVKSLSFQIDYQGFVDSELLKTCSGTSLTCGIMRSKSISLRKRFKNLSDNGGGDLDIKTSIRGKPIFGTSIVPKIKTRRNPSGDEVEEETGSRG